MPESPPALLPGEIHVWHLAADGDSAAPVAALLDDDERARADRFARPADRDLFVATRGWLRRLLGQYLGLPGDQLPLEAGAYGKPRLAANGAPRFNVSHSGTRSLLAFAADREVGVDIERYDARPGTLELAPTLFTAAEQAWLAASPDAARIEDFFRLWTGKEAVLKAAGGGLSIPLQAFSVTPVNESAIVNVIMETMSPVAATAESRPAIAPLCVQWLHAPPEYAAALAADGAPWQLRVFHLSEPFR